MRSVPLLSLVGFLCLTIASAWAQAGGSGTGAGGPGVATGGPANAPASSGLAGDWSSFWWIIALVVALVLAAIFIRARRQRP